MIPSRSFLLGSLHSLLFSKVLEGFGAFFYSSPRDSSNLMPALFCLPRFYCVPFLHSLFGYKMSYAIFILFLCSFFWDMLCMITYSLIFISFLLGNFNILLHVLDFVNVEDGDYADFVTLSSHSSGI